MDKNVTNARDLLEALIKTTHDLFKESEDEKEGEGKKHPVTGTPKHSRDELDADLFDTPEMDEHSNPVYNRRLKKRVDAAAKSVVIQLGMGGGSDKASGYVHAEYVVGGMEAEKDTWSEKEDDLVVYGKRLSSMKKYGVEKEHVNNVNRVKKEYPGLELVMNGICTDNARVKEVAETIRSVPMMDRPKVQGSELHGPETISAECGYKDLEKNGPTLNEPLRARSKRLYEQRKKEEVTRMDVFSCFVHPKKNSQTVLNMSKCRRPFFYKLVSVISNPVRLFCCR